MSSVTHTVLLSGSAKIGKTLILWVGLTIASAKFQIAADLNLLVVGPKASMNNLQEAEIAIASVPFSHLN